MNRSHILDIVARLLATENLNIVRDNVPTASFNVKERTLTMPIFKGMTDVIEEMMVAHEVGHAKHTSQKLLKDANEYHKVLPQYLNVIEDVRIEKHMKREYPGLRKSFHAGYGELNAMDFFGAKRQNPNDYNLIDKINLYYKVGYDCGVTFNDKEMEFVIKAEGTESERDAFKLAVEIFEYQRKRNKIPPDQPDPQVVAVGKMAAQFPGDGDEEEDGEGDGTADASGAEDGDSISGAPDPSACKSDQEGEADMGRMGSKTGQGGHSVHANYLESKTEEAFAKALDRKVDMQTKYEYHTIIPIYGQHPIVPYKRVLEETDNLPIPSTVPLQKAASKADIGYLVKEFEMRKSAETYNRATVAKTGMLDSKKLYAYSLKDDIFRRHSIIPKGKNHGMIFLIDWSISMADTINNVLRQTVDLAMFCRRCSIPFEMYAFTTGYRGIIPQASGEADRMRQADQLRKRTSKNAINIGDGGFHLLQMLSSKMTNQEFNVMTDRILSFKLNSRKGYTLGGTPLNEALIFMLRRIPEFQAEHGIEKMTFVTMTDGEGSNVHYMSPIAGTMKVEHFFVDEQSKKQYKMNNQTQTHAILKMIRDRTGCASIGFHIIPGDQQIAGTVESMTGHELEYSEKVRLTQEMRAAMGNGGSYILPSSSRDAMIIVKNRNLATVQHTMNVNSTTPASEIQRQLAVKMNSRKGNRIVLDTFIKTIA